MARAIGQHGNYHHIRQQLYALRGGSFGFPGARKGTQAGRWLAGAVAPKYRNPENPAETWAGRVLKPRWLAAKLKSDKRLEDFSIAASGKGSGARRRKAAKH